MNGQNFGERFDSPAFSERKIDFPLAVAPEPTFKNVSILAGLVEQTPLGVYIPVAGPLDDTLVNDFPVREPVALVEPITGDFSTSAPQAEPVTVQSPSVANVEVSNPLLNRYETDILRARWNEIQGKFVDEPRAAVESADTLVSDVIERISRIFTTEQGSLENQWKQGTDVSTEDLRKTLQNYHIFFNRLVV
jgi:hypothetical protein